MIPYIIVALWPLVMMCFYQHTHKNSTQSPSTFILVCTCLPMFLLIALRGETMGSDTSVYSRHFEDSMGLTLQQMSDSSRMEIGYLAFVKIISSFIESPKLYQIIYTCIYMIGIISFAKLLKGSDSFLFFYFVCTLGLFLFFFTGIRQCLAISICLFSYQYLMRKKYWLFILLLALAYTFHKSSLLFIIVLFISNRNLRWYNYLLYIVSMFIISNYLLELQMWANDNFDYNYEIENAGGGEIFLILLIILTTFSYTIIKRNKSVVLLLSFFNVNFITLMFWFLRLETRVAERPSFYFLAFSCALFASCINKLPKVGPASIFKYLAIFVTFALYIYRLLFSTSDLVPYSFF